LAKKLSEQAAKAVRSNTLYKQVFGTPEGEEVLKDLMKSAGVLSSTYVKGDIHETLIREGERRLVLRILQTVEVDIEKFKALYEEISEEE